MRGLDKIKHTRIGVGVEIHPTAEFIGVDELTLGDHSYIGPGVRIIGGRFSVGDYSKIHNNCYIYAKNFITFGHCSWFGQGTHLDGTGGITAGNFIGVGINSALYSHIRHGDITEGCKYDKNGHLRIDDDVWFVGMCLVSPVHAKAKSVAMLGSVVVKDMEENTVVGGNPAKDITARAGRPWVDRSVDEKMARVSGFIDEFCAETPGLPRDRFVVCDKLPAAPAADTTYYGVRERRYTKTNSADEVRLNKWLFGYRAKFVPAEPTGKR